MRVALVHDYLSQDGGAERVLKAFHELWPEAPIFVLFHDPEKITDFQSATIHQSFLSRLPFVRRHFQWYLPLIPLATEKYNLEDFDVVLSSTSAFAKGVLTAPHTLHISYCHTPARYLWSDTHQYIANLKYNPVIKAFLPRLISKMRLWDTMSADRVDHFVANSRTVQYRIQKYYRRESDVIHPPVDLSVFKISEKPGGYFVAGGRLVPYKNLDIVVRAFNRLQEPLKIFGTGSELNYLRSIAKPNIVFLGRVSETEKAELLSGARAFIHPQIEDFGITPLESMASGRPVIAYAVGGATETVIPNETGVFFNEQNWESLYDTVLNFDSEHWDSRKIRDHAATFDRAIFKDKIKNYVAERYEEFQTGIRQVALPVQ
ncbi:MAG: glycosyltransferase [Candidatus Magasanikbacteria bacterium]|nr:glycosyltransferase [Candidatus Magasanikbacteria bacterium]